MWLVDNVIFRDNGDRLKRFRFEASGITSGHIRLYTCPDANGTLALIEGGPFTEGSVPFSDGNGVLIEDNVKFSFDDTNDILNIASLESVNFIDFNTAYMDGVAEGRLQWNTPDGTLEFGLPGGDVNLQIGQEILIRGKNDTGITITNGQAVRISGVSGSRPTFGLAEADVPATAGSIGLATEDISNGNNGYVTTFGLVRDVNTSDWNVGDRLYVSNTAGELTSTAPTSTERIIFIGIVIVSNPSSGVIWVDPINVSYLSELSGVTITAVDGNDIIAYDSDSGIWVNTADPTFDSVTIDSAYTLPTVDGAASEIIKTDGGGVTSWVTPMVDVPVVLTMFDAEPARAAEEGWNGGLLELDNAASVGPATPANDFTVSTKGSGKIMIAVNTSSDSAGDITITGTSVSRDTMAQTGGATSVITINGTTTDSSAVDGNGNTVHGFTKAYITDKWYTGVVVISTSNVTIEDMDVFHVSFDQFGDHSGVTINQMDFNVFSTGVSAEFDAYMYTLEVTGDECDVTMVADVHVGSVGGAKAQPAVANKYYRLRQGAIAAAIDGTSDGFWVDITYAGTPIAIEDVTGKVWADISHELTLN